jgi:flagellar assembly protein FliH
MTNQPNRILDGEEASRCTTWNLPEFNNPGEHIVALQLKEEEQEVKPLTVKEIEKISQEAYEAAFEQGKKEGYQAGLSQGQDQVNQSLQQLDSIMNALLKPLENQNDQLEQLLVKLSLSIAKSVAKCELHLNSEHILDIVKEAIQAVPLGGDHTKIFLNPADFELIEAYRQNHNLHWRLISDQKMTKGGCCVETEHSVVDFSVEHRVQLMVERLFTQHGLNASVSDEPS